MANIEADDTLTARGFETGDDTRDGGSTTTNYRPPVFPTIFVAADSA
jgi:hypothetical protein